MEAAPVGVVILPPRHLAPDEMPTRKAYGTRLVMGKPRFSSGGSWGIPDGAKDIIPS